MILPHVLVISTGYRCDSAPCLTSVRAQQGVTVDHRWVDAAKQDPPQKAMTNVSRLLSGVPPETIVAWVDLDDRLLGTDALAKVAQRHTEGAWVTYGSFRFKDGRPGFAAQYPLDANVRTHPWLATHLKTFRAGLFHRIHPNRLQKPGEKDYCQDLAVMLPAMEMAGPERCAFIPDTLYEYDLAASHEFSTDSAGHRAERESAAWFRSLPTYARRETL